LYIVENGIADDDEDDVPVVVVLNAF
jgi:hypothetical protein